MQMKMGSRRSRSWSAQGEERIMRTREMRNDPSFALGISPQHHLGQTSRGSNAPQAPQRGVALFLAIFALLLLSAIGLAMLFSSDTETSISINYRDKQGAIYGAIAGLQEARDRLHPLGGDLGPGTNLSTGGLNIVPTALPSTAAPNVLYIINPAPGETVAPWLPTISGKPNPYFDDELCHETYFVNNLGVTAGTPGARCPATSASVPSGSSWYAWYDNSQKQTNSSLTGTGDAAVMETAYQLKDSSGNKIPLAYKWVRVTLKSDNMTPVSVSGGTSGSPAQLCWDQNAFREKPLPGGYNPDCTPISGGITNIPVAVNGAGYTSAPTVTITGGTGSGATAVATIGQLPVGITSVTLTNPGAGYTSVPAVTVTPADLTGSGAIVNATLNSTDPVSSVTPQGSTWASPPACYPTGSVPTVSFNPPSATATVTMTGQSCVYSITATAGSKCKDASSTVTASGGFSGTVTWGGAGNTATKTSVTNPGNYSSALPGSSAFTVSCAKPVGGGSPTVTPTYGIQINTVNLTTGGLYQPGNPPGVTFGGAATPVGGFPSATATLSGTANPSPLSGLYIPVGGNGSGYDTNPVLTIAPCIPGPNCVQATGTASITPDVGVLSIVVTNPGNGYSNALPPTVSITGGGGSGAVAGTPNIGSAATASYMGRVYLLTTLAVTRTGARAMAQMEVGVAHDQFNFGLGGALTLLGPSPGYGTPHSMPFQINGNDCPTCAPAPSGCPNPTTANPAEDAIGVYDPTNATNPSAVQTVINALAKPQNYIGVNSSPDVHNANLGNPTASELDGIVDNIALQLAGPSNTYGTRAAPVNNPTLNNMGTAANPAFNVVYGDYTMGPTTGYGILVVTGTLTFSGNYSWDGLILVIGQGASIMNGGGNGQIFGSVYVANTSTGTLGSPNVNWSGGGGNGIQYDHCWADYMESLIPPLPPSIDANPLKVISLRTEVY